MSDDDRKSAGATLANEALKVLPEADKQMAGRGFGRALANLGGVAEDLTLFLRVIVGVPRAAAGFVVRAAEQFRRTPPDRRALPSPKLLLEAAAGYAAVADDELKIRYERLLSSAMDVGKAPRVHPAFVEMLGEMTGTEARLLDYIPKGGYFESHAALVSALGFPLADHQFAVAMRNLVRLGLVDNVPPALVKPEAANTPELKRSLARLLGGIHVVTVSDVPMEDLGDRITNAHVTRASHYRLTPLGDDFLAVVGDRAP